MLTLVLPDSRLFRHLSWILRETKLLRYGRILRAHHRLMPKISEVATKSRSLDWKDSGKRPIWNTSYSNPSVEALLSGVWRQRDVLLVGRDWKKDRYENLSASRSGATRA